MTAIVAVAEDVSIVTLISFVIIASVLRQSDV